MVYQKEIQILRCIAIYNPTNKNKIKKLTKITYKTIWLKLRFFQEKGIIKFDKFYQLTNFGKEYLTFLNDVEKLRTFIKKHKNQLKINGVHIR